MNNFFNKTGLKIALTASAIWIIIATFFINVSRINIFGMGLHIKLADLINQSNIQNLVIQNVPFLIITVLVISLAIAQVILAFISKNTKLPVWFGVGAQAFNILAFAAITPIINSIVMASIKNEVSGNSSISNFISSSTLSTLIEQYKFTPDWGVYLVITFALLTIMYLVSYYTATFRNSNDAPMKIELAKEEPKQSEKKATAKKSTSKATATKTSTSKSSVSKTATKKTPTKKTTAKKPVAKKSTNKPSAVKKTATKSSTKK